MAAAAISDYLNLLSHWIRNKCYTRILIWQNQGIILKSTNRNVSSTLSESTILKLTELVNSEWTQIWSTYI